LRQVVRFYHETLKESPEALAYLEKRGLQSAEAIERFGKAHLARRRDGRSPCNLRFGIGDTPILRDGLARRS